MSESPIIDSSGGVPQSTDSKASTNRGKTGDNCQLGKVNQ